MANHAALLNLIILFTFTLCKSNFHSQNTFLIQSPIDFSLDQNTFAIQSENSKFPSIFHVIH